MKLDFACTGCGRGCHDLRLLATLGAISVATAVPALQPASFLGLHRLLAGFLQSRASLAATTAKQATPPLILKRERSP